MASRRPRLSGRRIHGRRDQHHRGGGFCDDHAQDHADRRHAEAVDRRVDASGHAEASCPRLDERPGQHGDPGDQAGEGHGVGHAVGDQRGEHGEAGRGHAERPGRPRRHGPQEAGAQGGAGEQWPTGRRGVGCGAGRRTAGASGLRGGPHQRGEQQDHHQVDDQRGGVRPWQPLGDRPRHQWADAEAGRGGDRGAPGGRPDAGLHRHLLQPRRARCEDQADGDTGEHASHTQQHRARGRADPQVGGQGDQRAECGEQQGRTHHCPASASVGHGSADHQGGDQSEDVDGEHEVHRRTAEGVRLTHDRQQRGEEVRPEGDGEHAQGDGHPGRQGRSSPGRSIRIW